MNKKVQDKRQTEFKCPLCSNYLFAIDGSKLNPKDGVTLWCDAPQGNVEGMCPAQEVFGHAKDEKSAYEIIKQKYKKMV
jgi:hypothetical protein